MDAIKAKTPTPIDERARIELDAHIATEAVEQARRKFEADQAALARLEAETDLPPNATDAQIKDHLGATDVARVRVRQSKRAFEAAQEAAKSIVEQAAKAAREAERRRTMQEQAEIVERFRAEYPTAVSNLLRLFAEAHAIEMAAQKLAEVRVDGVEPYVSAFRFSSPFGPSALRIQILGRGGDVIWQGDQNTDVESQRA